jgi:hypothetical protein
MNDDIFVVALFEVLETGPDEYVFVGDVEIVHVNYIVALSSYSEMDVDHGTLYRFRGPVWEFYRYSVSYKGGDMGEKKDRGRYDQFNVVQSPLELFIVCVALGYLTIYMPKRYAREYRKVKVKALHQGAWGLVILLFVIYMLGLDGLFIWVLGPLFLILIFALSHKIYKQGWKGIAKPLSEVEKKELDREDGIIRPESYKKLGGRRRPEDLERFEDEYDEEPPRRRGRPPRRRPRDRGPRRERRPREPEYDDDHYDDDRYEDDHYDDDYDDDYDDRHEDEEYEERPRRPPPVRRPPPGPAPREEVIPEEEEDEVHDMEPIVERRKIRCAGCKKIFEAEIRQHPQKIQCPMCGKLGMIK